MNTAYLRALRRDLAAGRTVTDSRFDRLYPPEVRVHAKVHFTPVAVAQLAREWLGAEAGLRLLDVGSGCGKFCQILAASGPGRITGIEQRPTLDQIARQTAQSLELTTVDFLCGPMEDLDWRGFNTFYFFNPFYERIAHRAGIDDQIPQHAGIYFDLVRTVRQKLEAAKSSQRVLTYHGLGGHLPADWVLLRRQPIGSDELQLWQKA